MASVKIKYQFITSVIIWYHFFHISEQLVPISEDLVPIFTHLSSLSTVPLLHMCEDLVAFFHFCENLVPIIHI